MYRTKHSAQSRPEYKGLFFFFFFLAASWNLITRILLPFGNACHYSDIYPILYFESATIIYIYILYLYKYIYNMFVYIYIYRTYSVQMMKCIVITPWPVWLGSVDAPCLFGLLSKPQPVTNVIGKRAAHCNRAAHPRRSLAIISSQAV